MFFLQLQAEQGRHRGGGGLQTSLGQRNSQNFCSNQILIPVSAAAVANEAPRRKQPTRDKSASRL